MLEFLSFAFILEALGGLFFLGTMALSLAMTVFWIWMLVDCATKESSKGNDKVVWILVIILTNILGALIYFFARRPTRIEQLGR